MNTMRASDQNLSRISNFRRNNIFSTQNGTKGQVVGINVRSLNEIEIEILFQNYQGLIKLKVQSRIGESTLERIVNEYPHLMELRPILSKCLERLKYIQELSLYDSHLRDKDIVSLPSILSLKELSLIKNGISPLGMKELSKFPNLTSLQLDKNNIGSQGARVIAKYFPEMRHLSLWSCSLDNWGAIAISSLKKLEYLNLGVNAITNKGFMKVISNTRSTLKTLKMWGVQASSKCINISKKVSLAKNNIFGSTQDTT